MHHFAACLRLATLMVLVAIRVAPCSVSANRSDLLWWLYRPVRFGRIGSSGCMARALLSWIRLVGCYLSKFIVTILDLRIRSKAIGTSQPIQAWREPIPARINVCVVYLFRNPSEASFHCHIPVFSKTALGFKRILFHQNGVNRVLVIQKLRLEAPFS
jgi:hypothetical protein